MSAYMVGKNHIAFLIAAANRCQPRSYGLFKWRHDGKWHQLDRHTGRVAQMLMDANLERVHRYPNEVDLPGPVNGAISSGPATCGVPGTQFQRPLKCSKRAIASSTRAAV